ncbi:unnamed protein product [Gadus morhua 'NCC']
MKLPLQQHALWRSDREPGENECSEGTSVKPQSCHSVGVELWQLLPHGAPRNCRVGLNEQTQPPLITEGQRTAGSTAPEPPTDDLVYGGVMFTF